MTTPMNYYIAEHINSDTMSHLTNLVKRFDSLEGAQDYLRLKMREWRDEGLHAECIRVGHDIWGAIGRTKWQHDGGEESCKVIHMMDIFATPLFMAGGHEGL